MYVFSFRCLLLVLLLWVAPLKSFKCIHRENMLDYALSAIYKCCNFSLWPCRFGKSKNFSNVNVREVLALFLHGWNVLHHGAIKDWMWVCWNRDTELFWFWSVSRGGYCSYDRWIIIEVLLSLNKQRSGSETLVAELIPTPSLWDPLMQVVARSWTQVFPDWKTSVMKVLLEELSHIQTWKRSESRPNSLRAKRAQTSLHIFLVSLRFATSLRNFLNRQSNRVANIFHI